MRRDLIKIYKNAYLSYLHDRNFFCVIMNNFLKVDESKCLIEINEFAVVINS
jgi:hypothetical protein